MCEIAAVPSLDAVKSKCACGFAIRGISGSLRVATLTGG